MVEETRAFIRPQLVQKPVQTLAVRPRMTVDLVVEPFVSLRLSGQHVPLATRFSLPLVGSFPRLTAKFARGHYLATQRPYPCAWSRSTPEARRTEAAFSVVHEAGGHTNEVSHAVAPGRSHACADCSTAC